MKKLLVLKLDLHGDKDEEKVMKKVSRLSGIDSFSLQNNKLMIIGNVDSKSIVRKLKKLWHTEVISFGPAKEPEKKEEPMKENPNACVIC